MINVLKKKKNTLRPLNEWKPLIRIAKPAVVRANETIVFLHLPKTGGSTFNYAVRNSSDWIEYKFPPLHVNTGTVCGCKDPLCDKEVSYLKKLEAFADSIDDTKHLFVTTGHSTFAESTWLAERLSTKKGTPQILAVVRPARERIVSMFRDYWEQVATAEEYLAGTKSSTVHRHAVGRRYLADSQHYRDETGRIDGVAWFSTFAQYRGGVTFLMEQVFEQQPDVLANALADGRLKAIPTAELDATTESITGKEARRRRVSSAPSAFLTAAIEESAELIDAIAAFDAPFDAVLADHLGAERFDPKKAR